MVVHERSDHVGHRFVGDLHGVENWSTGRDFRQDLRELGLLGTFDCTPAFEVLISNGSRIWPVRSRSPLFFVVARGPYPGCLEHGLLQTALEAGVDIRFEDPVGAGNVDVMATGPDPRHVFAIEKGIKFRTDADDLALGLVHSRAAPFGYAYLLIRGGIGCLCTVLFGKFHTANQALETATELLQKQLGFSIRDPHPLGGSGSYRPCRLVQAGRALWAGEAAGVQDFLWGFGIRKAMTSGEESARCLLGLERCDDLARHHAACHRVAVVNRCAWEMTVPAGLSIYARRMRGEDIPLRALRRAFRADAQRGRFYALARQMARRRFPRLAW